MSIKWGQTTFVLDSVVVISNPPDFMVGFLFVSEKNRWMLTVAVIKFYW
jgi:hypothetical protein